MTSVDKSNVLENSQLWRRVVTEVAKDYPDVTLDHLLVDNCAMQLVLNPKRFDIVLTENMFGDILSDEGAVIAGSIGMLPSASIGEKRPSGAWTGLYEPVHGSAPDIAGQNKANPLGAIGSVAAMLEYTFRFEGRKPQAVNRAMEAVLAQGPRDRGSETQWHAGHHGTGRRSGMRGDLSFKSGIEMKTIIEKVWDSHVVYEQAGAPALLYIDLHLVHEVTSPAGLRRPPRARAQGAAART